ncbi:TetR/AcrR family transcriptional regulator [Novosphingobium huizhouense]|uniref:TetR/AcrR family transcriptional regulator n=1 Tax=Novosphingobium huizhouense TaxID=2866625 RepID=UPI001CD8712E|nr:TetR/AcrR family transcriptional regulator [Novosphingobium huizhouense]
MASRSDLSPRAARTRAALIAAGFDLLARKPIDAIPIDEVVALAGVAKGSFFNHFADKPAFADAIAAEVRLELEEQVDRANAEIADPVARIAGGMRVAAAFARAHPTRATVLLRSAGRSTDRRHPLNRGLSADFAAAIAQGRLRAEAEELGVVYWLGLCQVLMTNLLEQPCDEPGAEARVTAMIAMGLAGLGVADRAAGTGAGAAITRPG